MLLSVYDNANAFQNVHITTSRTTARSRIIPTTKTDEIICSLSRGKNNNNHDGDSNDENDAELLLEYSIDSFLRGDYDRTFAEDAASPLPGLSPSDTVDAALRSLRDMDEPEPSHGAAVLLRFCVQLGRGERWGTDNNNNSNSNSNSNSKTSNTAKGQQRNNKSSKYSSSWKELLRGALTPTMLARRLRASEDFSGLLDWIKLDVTEGVLGGQKEQQSSFSSQNSNSYIAFVNAALYFDKNNQSPPELYQFKLAKMLGGVWLIDSVQRSPSSLFASSSSKSTTTTTKSEVAPKGGNGGERKRQQRGKIKGDGKRKQSKEDDGPNSKENEN